MLQDFNQEGFISAQESHYVTVSNPALERAVLSKELAYGWLKMPRNQKVSPYTFKDPQRVFVTQAASQPQCCYLTLTYSVSLFFPQSTQLCWAGTEQMPQSKPWAGGNVKQ